MVCAFGGKTFSHVAAAAAQRMIHIKAGRGETA